MNEHWSNEQHRTRTTVYSYKCKENHYAVKDATTLYKQLGKETRIKKFTGLPRFKPWYLWYPCPRGDNPVFKWQGWSNGDKNQNPKNSLGLQTKLTKIPCPKFNRQKIPCCQFLSHKNFQKALNDITWKMETLAMECLCLFCNVLNI